MAENEIRLSQADVQKLLGARSGDTALLYLYIRSGADAQGAREALGLSESRYSCACASLKQLDLWPREERVTRFVGEKPSYSEQDVLQARDGDSDFRMLTGEVQRVLGRTLNTEELKILLGFLRYLGLPPEVVTVLVSYCRERARWRGSLRNPSLRTIEKEAYYWSEHGLDTLEAAAAYIQEQNQKNSRMSRLLEILQIRGRSLTQAEERYASAWLAAGYSDELLSMAYERTCLNTGSLNWPYMNKILERWSAAGFRTGAEVLRGDRKGGPAAERKLDEDELYAIRKMMGEG